MEKPKKRIARCVLCQSCANWTGRRDVERRQTRICGAGLNPTRMLFECDSYVRDFAVLPSVRIPARRRRSLPR